MPAERGPSGTGHDGEGMPTDREWLEGLACQSSYPHEAHGSCPGLRRPSDPPVAVPGPASVSPADTPDLEAFVCAVVGHVRPLARPAETREHFEMRMRRRRARARRRARGSHD